MTTDSRHADAARAPGTDTWALRRTCRAAVGDLACGTKPAEPLRQRVCHGLIRNIVEVGFGSGVNVPFYPSAVTAVAAVEPSRLRPRNWRTNGCGQRLSVCTVGIGAQTPPSPGDGFTRPCPAGACARSPDAVAALQELRRVRSPPSPCKRPDRPRRLRRLSTTSGGSLYPTPSGTTRTPQPR